VLAAEATSRDRTAIADGSSRAGVYRMSAFEVSTGWLTGFDAEPGRSTSAPVMAPLDALERAVSPLVASPPCVVAFSGGRDSSLVLAAAVRAARRIGAPQPIAVTRVYPSVPDTAESTWQELVVRRLGVTEWVRLTIDDELDLVGPLAVASLRRHGLLWPPMSHVNTPLFDAARHGSLLTGEGGDTILGAQRVTATTAMIRRRVRPSRAVLAAAALSLAPARIRRTACSGDVERSLGRPWLRSAARAELAERLVADEVAAPLDWRAAVRRWTRQRALRMGLQTMQRLALDDEVRLVHPLLEPTFVEAVAAAGGRLGFGGRSQLMDRLFADVLPSEVLRRSDKATFNGTAFGVHARAFAATWDGSGVDDDLVDPSMLLQEWQKPRPSAASFALLQAAWLAWEAA
jgi:asparagine synthase (glutamine-hydrolysing)